MHVRTGGHINLRVLTPGTSAAAWRLQSQCTPSDKGHRHDPFDPRANPRSHNHHHRPAARAQNRRPLLEPSDRPARSQSQQQLVDDALVRKGQRPEFGGQGEGINGLLIGKPGTSKSHIAKAVAYQATLQGYDVRYVEAYRE